MNAKNIEQIDSGIINEVQILNDNGIETFQSCQGGKGHPYFEPTVEFHGEAGEGPRAFGIAIINGLKPIELQRFYQVVDKELRGPYWRMTFYHEGVNKTVEETYNEKLTVID